MRACEPPELEFPSINKKTSYSYQDYQGDFHSASEDYFASFAKCFHSEKWRVLRIIRVDFTVKVMEI